MCTKDEIVWRNLAKMMASRGHVPVTDEPLLISPFLSQAGGIWHWKFTNPNTIVWHIPGKLYVEMVRYLCKHHSDCKHLIIQKEDATHTAVAEMCQMAPDSFEMVEEVALSFDLLEACSGIEFEVLTHPLPPLVLKQMPYMPRILKTDALIAHYKLPVNTVIFVPSEYRYYVVK